MKIVIEGDAKEIASLVLAVQGRQELLFQEICPKLTMDIRSAIDGIREEVQQK